MNIKYRVGSHPLIIAKGLAALRNLFLGENKKSRQSHYEQAQIRLREIWHEIKENRVSIKHGEKIPIVAVIEPIGGQSGLMKLTTLNCFCINQRNTAGKVSRGCMMVAAVEIMKKSQLETRDIFDINQADKLKLRHNDINIDGIQRFGRAHIHKPSLVTSVHYVLGEVPVIEQELERVVDSESYEGGKVEPLLPEKLYYKEGIQGGAPHCIYVVHNEKFMFGPKRRSRL